MRNLFKHNITKIEPPIIYCDDDGGQRVYRNICDNLCVQRFYKKHLKPGTHFNIIPKRQQLNNTNL